MALVKAGCFTVALCVSLKAILEKSIVVRQPTCHVPNPSRNYTKCEAGCDENRIPPSGCMMTLTTLLTMTSQSLIHLYDYFATLRLSFNVHEFVKQRDTLGASLLRVAFTRDRKKSIMLLCVETWII